MFHQHRQLCQARGIAGFIKVLARANASACCITPNCSGLQTYEGVQKRQDSKVPVAVDVLVKRVLHKNPEPDETKKCIFLESYLSSNRTAESPERVVLPDPVAQGDLLH